MQEMPGSLGAHVADFAERMFAALPSTVMSASNEVSA